MKSADTISMNPTFRKLLKELSTMKKWHHNFEKTHPDGHKAFLSWLGIPPEKIVEIRGNSK